MCTIIHANYSRELTWNNGASRFAHVFPTCLRLGIATLQLPSLSLDHIPVQEGSFHDRPINDNCIYLHTVSYSTTLRQTSSTHMFGSEKSDMMDMLLLFTSENVVSSALAVSIVQRPCTKFFTLHPLPSMACAQDTREKTEPFNVHANFRTTCMGLWLLPPVVDVCWDA